MYKRMDKKKKCGKKRKYDGFAFNLSQETTQRVKVPFESLSTAPRRSKRIKQNRKSDVKVYNSTTDYYAHSQGKSIFHDIERNYEKVMSKRTQDFATRFGEVLREQVPRCSKAREKTTNTIKALVAQIDSILDGGGGGAPLESRSFVPENRWVYRTPSHRKENIPPISFSFDLPQSLSPGVNFFAARTPSFDFDQGCFS
ncbi:hypothetical protein PPYR_03335 [Photinus pyralis]|uniref:Uncharacterized protein n=2 Tax=Photinus pyralis TaxID=7054 RepID=A0A5N4A2I6_PHOPY|nr:hypothetical protein PPYR_03335 [Photinus pyralis]